MIVEQGLLRIVPGQEDAFEEAMRQATPLISSMPGFQRLQVSRGLEDAGTYLLIVEWDTLEDHTEGFRGSDEYQEWRTMLHHFYDPFPTIGHFDPVIHVNAD